HQYSEIYQRPVAPDQHARAAFAVLDADLVIRRLLPKSSQLGIERVAPLEIFGECEFLPANFAQAAHVLGRGRCKRETEYSRRASILTINAQEIVVVHPSLDRSLPGVHQSVLDHHHRLVFQKTNSLDIAIGIPRTACQLLRELNPVSPAVYGALSAIHDRIVSVRAVSRVVDLAQRSDPDLAEGFSGFRLGIS